MKQAFNHHCNPRTMQMLVFHFYISKFLSYVPSLYTAIHLPLSLFFSRWNVSWIIKFTLEMKTGYFLRFIDIEPNDFFLILLTFMWEFVEKMRVRKYRAKKTPTQLKKNLAPSNWANVVISWNISREKKWAHSNENPTFSYLIWIINKLKEEAIFSWNSTQCLCWAVGCVHTSAALQLFMPLLLHVKKMRLNKNVR